MGHPQTAILKGTHRLSTNLWVSYFHKVARWIQIECTFHSTHLIQSQMTLIPTSLVEGNLILTYTIVAWRVAFCLNCNPKKRFNLRSPNRSTSIPSSGRGCKGSSQFPRESMFVEDYSRSHCVIMSPVHTLLDCYTLPNYYIDLYRWWVVDMMSWFTCWCWEC